MNCGIFSIGHSNHTTETFLSLLCEHKIMAIADVRSSPRTRVNPDFSYPQLKQILNNEGIDYISLGEELGARSSDETCYVNGRVSYERLARQHLFEQGLDRLEMESEEHRIALLCAEKEPLDCHRCILVSRHLVARGLTVKHILANGAVEDHAETLMRLKELLNLFKQRDMFMSDTDLDNIAYQTQEAKIAYELPEESLPQLIV